MEQPRLLDRVREAIPVYYTQITSLFPRYALSTV